MREETRLALGIFAMNLFMMMGGILGGIAFYFLLVTLDHTDYAAQDAGYRILGLCLSVVGGILSAILTGFVLGQFFWNKCSPPELES